MSTEVAEAELTKRITDEVTALLEAEYLDKLNKFQDELTQRSNEAIAAALDEWRKDQEAKELSDDDLSKLLNQEYATFTVKIPVQGEEAPPTDRTFTLRELPQSIEKKFIKNMVVKIKPHLQAIAAITEKVIEGTITTKLETILDSFEPGLEIMADTVVMILNPFGKETDVTTDWVSTNISTRRQWNIIQAQERLNNLRSFFSPASLGFPGKK